MHPLIAIPTSLALIYRAYSHKSLTPLGILAAALTALIHALHPSPLPFALLGVFFLAGTAVTKVKHDVKASLTQSSGGAAGGEGARTSVQVLANSGVASVLVLVGVWRGWARGKGEGEWECWGYGGDVVLVGIICNYAAVAADTFSSELGILSKTKPRLLTSLNLREVPPGTNGGVTLVGTGAGFAGALIIALISVVLIPFCGLDDLVQRTELGSKSSLDGGSGWTWREKGMLMLAITALGGLGSLLDSALGGWLQESVVDARTGKIIEGIGGKKVLVTGSRTIESKKSDEPSRRVESGLGVLDNNAVNFLMAAIMSIDGMMVASWWWRVPLNG